jgi:anthranilate phosphoribosyltransferase
MDFSVSIPAASATETTTMVPQKSPSFKVVPVLHDEMAKQLPGHSILGAKSAAILLVKKVFIF